MKRVHATLNFRKESVKTFRRTVVSQKKLSLWMLQRGNGWSQRQPVKQEETPSSSNRKVASTTWWSRIKAMDTFMEDVQKAKRFSGICSDFAWKAGSGNDYVAILKPFLRQDSVIPLLCMTTRYTCLQAGIALTVSMTYFSIPSLPTFGTQSKIKVRKRRVAN